ncbi:hypothetical protein LLEC1_01181 [Akanthomyces lecanii]|uniref:Uncharacterized protein n=1 Tax=Cordyceps confragosa TaxID=2714763 RepID=A0A179ID46_CORDF|nr:hypothetical protein LLEC1_01181 [Akanthomyces lecanii]
MAHPASPVSRAALKRLELRTGSSNRVFMPNHNAGHISFSLQRQQSSSLVDAALILAVHNENKPLISIRLTDVLRNSGRATDIISTNPSVCIICVKVPTADCTLLAHFENARDFHVSVYVLERAGFGINNDTRVSPLDLAGAVPYRNVHNPGNAAPMRLSSITTFSPMSQPEHFSQGQPVASSGPVEPFTNWPLRRTESVPTQHFGDSLPFATISQSPVELNPYKHFATDRPSAASPHVDPYPRGAPIRGLNGANASETPLSSEKNSEQPKVTPGLHPTSHGGNEGLRSSLAVEQLDADALAKASDFRHLMPQARRLPFTKLSTENPKTSAKSSAKRKPRAGVELGTQVEQDPNSRPPIKKHRVYKKNVAKAQTEAKTQPRKVQRSKSQTIRGRKAEPEEGTAAATKATQRTPRSKQVSKSSAPRTRASAKTIPSENTGNEGNAKERLPEQAGFDTKGTTKKSQPKKSATKATPAKRLLEPSKSQKPPTTRSSIKTIDPKPALVDEASARTDSTTTHQYLQVENVMPRMIPEPPNPGVHSSSGILPLAKAESNATLLISDSTVLDALNQMTWKMMDQYETDLDCGLNRFDIAQYYVDSLYNARFEFWHDKLTELCDANAFHVRQPAL